MPGPDREPQVVPAATTDPQQTPATTTDVAVPTGAWQPAPAGPTSQQPTLPFGGPSPAGPLPEGGRFGRYELRGECRSGGMGVVYKARDTALDRVVALKLIKAGALAGPDEVARFQREARAVARLRHPHVVALHDVAREGGLHYLTMEYVGGGSLAQRLDSFAGDPRAACALLEKVARAVQYAHERGVLHRDLKPANILLDESGEPRVSDFGLAKFLDTRTHPTGEPAGPPPRRDGQEAPPETGLQTVGAVGTPAYMSPEQLAGGEVTPATDVWALGVILYQLLTGKLPFAGKAPADLAGHPPPPRRFRPGLDPGLEAICLKCLEADPARRYPSAGMLADDLERWLRGGGPLRRTWRVARRHPARAAALVLLLGTLAAVAGVALWPADPDRPVHAVQQDLARGKPVTLIGATGPPAWFRWKKGEAVARVTPTADQTFSVSSWDIAFLELLPDPRCESYRFSAEVRQREGPAGRVGLYVGRSTAHTGAKEFHRLCDWTNADRLASPQRAFTSLHFRYYEAGSLLNDSGPGADLTCSGPHFHEPARETAGDWRKMAVEVTPEAVRGYWQGEEVCDVPSAELRKNIEGMEQTVECLKGRVFSANYPGLPFDAHGGLGFYLQHCSASFRNVTIEPLVGGN